ncbi:MAG: polysaccharide lyase [Chitinophagaceae bacterium]
MKNHLTLLFLLLIAANCSAQVNVYDGFETATLGKLWRTDRMVKTALEMQATIFRKGHSAAKITLRSGDVYESGDSKSLDTERDELCEVSKLMSVEDKIYEYRVSLFLPDSFPIVPTRLVIAQWKQYCPEDVCTDSSPVLAIRYVSGKLYITVKTDTTTQTIFKTKNEVRNQWLDFTFKIKFSRLDSGFVKAWLNDKEIADYRGATCYSSAKGFADKGYFYFKTGLYRDLMSEPMTIYIDEYSKKEVTE